MNVSIKSLWRNTLSYVFLVQLLVPISIHATGGGGGTPPPPPPAPSAFQCTRGISYTEAIDVRLANQPGFSNLDKGAPRVKIESQGRHIIHGNTTSGAHGCAQILQAMDLRNAGQPHDTNAVPSSVSYEQITRDSWAFRTYEFSTHGNHSKLENMLLAGSTYPTLINFTPTDNRVVAGYKGRVTDWTPVVTRAPISNMASVNRPPLRLANQYEFYRSSTTGLHCRGGGGPLGGSCGWGFYQAYRHYYTPSLPRPTFTNPADPNVGIQISHADNPGAPLYPNSPIRARWQAQNANSGTCSMSTAPNVPELTFTNIPYAPVTERVVRPSDEIGQFFVDVNQQGNFVERRTRNPLLEPGNYTANVSCLLTNNPVNTPGFDDGLRTNALGPVTRLVNATTPFTINGDRVVTLTITRFPPTVDDNNPRARIIARTSNAEEGNTHNYSLQQIPNGYQLLSTNEQTRTANANGESVVAWDVAVITEGPDRANIGNAQFVAEMIDNFDNLYTGIAQFTYFGGRGVQEVQP